MSFTRQDELTMNGHAIEVRMHAENCLISRPVAGRINAVSRAGDWVCGWIAASMTATESRPYYRQPIAS